MHKGTKVVVDEGGVYGFESYSCADGVVVKTHKDGDITVEGTFTSGKTTQVIDWTCKATHVHKKNVRAAGDDPVSKPAHYDWHPSGVPCNDITQAFSFNLGNVIKYVWRAGRKDGNPVLQDLRKAAWYLQREIERLEKGGAK